MTYRYALTDPQTGRTHIARLTRDEAAEALTAHGRPDAPRALGRAEAVTAGGQDAYTLTTRSPRHAVEVRRV